MQYRKYQKETIQKIRELMHDTKVIFEDVPTGGGKSFINVLTAYEEGSGYITTPLKPLVDQYDRDLSSVFAGMGTIIKGRNNYDCIYSIANGNTTENSADGARCQTDSDWKCPYKSECYYYKAKYEAIASKVTVTTLAYMLNAIVREINNFGDIQIEEDEDENQVLKHWNKRKVLVIDEAHGLPDALADFYSFGTTDKKILFNLTGEVTHDLDYIIKYTEDEIERVKDEEQDEDKRRRRIFRLKTRLQTLENVKNNIDDFIYNFTENSATFKPFSVKNMAASIWKNFDNIVLSSATFLNYDRLIEETGLPNNYAVVSMPSQFPPENSRIYFKNIEKLNYKNINESIPKLYKSIVEILEKHKDEKGIIHNTSYKLQKALYEYDNDRFFIHENSKDKAEVMEEWQNSKNGVLLAVKMEEGIDLKYDKARFQIIVKTPYPDTSDKWIKKHLEVDGWDWYNERALLTLVQACGRVMRANDDYGITYLLDTNSFILIARYRHILQKWFLERIVWKKN